MTQIRSITNRWQSSEIHGPLFSDAMYGWGCCGPGECRRCFLGESCCILCFCGYVVFVYLQVVRLQNQAWQNFAAQNGWQFLPVADAVALAPPSLQFGHGAKAMFIIDAQVGDISFQLFLYSTMQRDFQGRDYKYGYTVARVSLPKSLPHIVLLAKKGTGTRPQFADHETVQLEGNFNDYFKLQIERGQEIDALSVITPDIMQALLQYSQNEDVEIAGAGLYFILGGDSRSAEPVQKLVQSVVAIDKQVMEYVRQTTASTPTVMAQPAAWSGTDSAPLVPPVSPS